MVDGVFAGGSVALDWFVVDDRDAVLRRPHPGGWLVVERPPLQLPGDGKGELDVYVRLDQGPLDVADDLLDQGLVHIARAGDFPKGLAQRTTEFFEDHASLPKGHSPLSFEHVKSTDGTDRRRNVRSAVKKVARAVSASR